MKHKAQYVQETFWSTHKKLNSSLEQTQAKYYYCFCKHFHIVDAKYVIYQRLVIHHNPHITKGRESEKKESTVISCN